MRLVKICFWLENRLTQKYSSITKNHRHRTYNNNLTLPLTRTLYQTSPEPAGDFAGAVPSRLNTDEPPAAAESMAARPPRGRGFPPYGVLNTIMYIFLHIAVYFSHIASDNESALLNIDSLILTIAELLDDQSACRCPLLHRRL